MKRAYFYAPVKRPIYIVLPAEDRLPGDEEMVGRLNLFLYGTRDAAQNWSREYTQTLTSCGFIVGRASPCNFYHPMRDLALTVHGDDFIVSGPEEELTWLANTLRSRWDVKASILGPDTHHEQEVKVLNRSIRWTAGGIEYEVINATSRLFWSS